MSLIKSISGIRGTIGGAPAENLTPVDIVKFAAAYGSWIQTQEVASPNNPKKVVIGRDGRISGPMLKQLVMATLTGLGIDVIDLGLSTTPTVEMAVAMEKANGGIILTASHNPKQWNALKLLNGKGEFISEELGKEVLSIAELDQVEYAEVDKLGTVTERHDYIQIHINEILKLELVDVELLLLLANGIACSLKGLN
jgi:phosphomannomutase